MENIRILARPEAYKCLSNPEESQRLKPVLELVIEIARDGITDLRFLNHLEFGIRTRWAKTSKEKSIILIYNYNEERSYNLLDPYDFELAIREAIPIPFFD